MISFAVSKKHWIHLRMNGVWKQVQNIDKFGQISKGIY